MSKHTHVIGCLFSLIVLGACAPHQPAMAGEPGADAARSAMATANAAAPWVADPVAPGVGDPAAPAVDEASFPLAIWRGIEFPGRTGLTGALLPTPDGPIQIKQLRWGVDQDGFLVVCSLTGYTQDGNPISFTGPDAEACTSAASKSDIQKAPVAVGGGGSLESFNFGTDYRGFLAFTDIVYRPGAPVGLQDACGMVTVIVCRNEGCSGDCGLSVTPRIVGNIMTLSAGIGSDPTMRNPINCNCTSGTGRCAAQAVSECAGQCPNEGQSCTLDYEPIPGLRCLCE